MGDAELIIGSWYRRTDNSLFEVVAIDEAASTVEIQHFDGTIDEIDMETWPGLLLEVVGAPEDWSGSIDMDLEVDHEFANESPLGWHDPLEVLDLADRINS